MTIYAGDRLWHDDIRRPPDSSWYWARTNRQAIYFLLHCLLSEQCEPCKEASLDHDLGLEEEDPDAPAADLRAGPSTAGDGVDLAMAMYHLRIAPPRVTIHSWNPEGAARMAGILREAGSEVTVCAYRLPSMDDHTYAGMFSEWPT